MKALSSSRRRVLLSLALASVSVSGFGMYVKAIGRTRVTPTALTLRLPRLSPAFDGYRLVHLSDIHVDHFMTQDRLSVIFDQVNHQSPDLILITGDFMTHSPGYYARSLIAALRRLVARDGVLAVLGNHDQWNGAEYIESLLEQGGATCLRNEVMTFRRQDSLLHVAGVDDYWMDLARIDDVLAKLSPDGSAILMAHEPDYADISAATGRFDLQLSGHTHGGQVVIPFLGPPILPRHGRKYPSGLYQVGTMYQYTNRGLGMVRPRVRFNCRPEIAVLTLRAAL